MRCAPSIFTFSLLLSGAGHASAHGPFKSGVETVAQCKNVTLHAAYLAEEVAGQGPGFLVEIRNEGPAPIGVADPVPLSVDWYAATGTRWLWRASSGSGGSLVNASNARGPVFVSRGPIAYHAKEMRIVPAHAAHTWAVFSGTAPTLRYWPRCQHCNYQGEEKYRAVLAYAYHPDTKDPASPLLQCGLRSNPVIMPPLAEQQRLHNSQLGNGFP